MRPIETPSAFFDLALPNAELRLAIDPSELLADFGAPEGSMASVRPAIAPPAPSMLESLLDPAASLSDLARQVDLARVESQPFEGPEAAPPFPASEGPHAAFQRFLDAVVDVARRHIDRTEVAHMRSLLEGKTRDPRLPLSFESTSRAFRTLLERVPGDLSGCGDQTLDQWAASLIAALAKPPADVGAIRQELRRRNVAAFGMLDAEEG